MSKPKSQTTLTVVQKVILALIVACAAAATGAQWVGEHRGHTECPPGYHLECNALGEYRAVMESAYGRGISLEPYTLHGNAGRDLLTRVVRAARRKAGGAR